MRRGSHRMAPVLRDALSAVGSAPGSLASSVSHLMPTLSHVSWLTVSTATPLYIPSHSAPDRLFVPRVCGKWWRRAECSANFTCPFWGQPCAGKSAATDRYQPGQEPAINMRKEIMGSKTRVWAIWFYEIKNTEWKLSSWHVRNACQKTE